MPDAPADETAALAHIAGLDGRHRHDAERLDKIFRIATGFTPRLWSGRMVGYGRYDYTYDSGHSGTWFATGFAVASRQISIYILPGYSDFGEITGRLGPHKRGKACLYITRLDAIGEDALSDLIRAGLADLNSHWTVRPT